MAISTPMVNLPNMYVNGLFLAYRSAKQIEVGPGQARDSTGNNDVYFYSTSFLSTGNGGDGVIDGTKNGAFGLDTGSLANNTFYAVYVIGNSYDNVPGENYGTLPSGNLANRVNVGAAIISKNIQTPLLPAGYNMYRRIGFILTDGSANFVVFTQIGQTNNTSRKMWYNTPIQILLNQSDGSFVDLNLYLAVPPIYGTVFSSENRSCVVECFVTPSVAGGKVNFAIRGSSVAIGSVSGDVANVVSTGNIEILANGSFLGETPPLASWSTTNASVTVNVVNYTDEL